MALKKNKKGLCSKCGVKLTEQNQRPSSRLASRSVCKSCEKAYQQGLLSKDPEIFKKAYKRYRQRHREQVDRRIKDWNLKNPEKMKIFQSNYRKRHFEIIRNKAMLKKYGISKVEIDQLLSEQGGRCAICRRDFTKAMYKNRRYPFVIDHDHTKEGKESVRGLLCDDCNIVLGRSKDDISTLKRAINYLTNFQLKFQREMKLEDFVESKSQIQDVLGSYQEVS